jgi:excinuclease UvrABC ATPase subunit
MKKPTDEEILTKAKDIVEKFYPIHRYYATLVDVCAKGFKAALSQMEETDSVSVKCIPFQVCPICNGKGQVVATGFTSSVYQQCDVCNGQKIIPMYQLPAPPKEG